MPGEPKITIEQGERDDILVRSVDAVVDVDQISFSANFQEYRVPVFVQKEADAQRQFTARAFGGRVARETAFTMNGFEAREMAIESDSLNGIFRFVMVNNRRIMLSVMGEQRHPQQRQRPPLPRLLQAAAITGDRVMTILRSMSRRAFLPLIAGVALSPVVLVPRPARAQGATWQMYRPEGLGFEVEMPGKPKIEIEKSDRDDILVRSVDAVVDVDQTTFGAYFQEFRKQLAMREEILGQQLFARALEGRITREVAFTMNGFEGRRIRHRVDGAECHRAARPGEATAGSHCPRSAIGPSTATPSVRRFLDSLKLLP